MDKKEIKNIIDFSKNFDGRKKKSVQLSNYKKFINYLEERQLTINTNDAELLLLKSKEIKKMVDVLSKIDLDESQIDNYLTQLFIANDHLNIKKVKDDSDIYDLDLVDMYLNDISGKLISQEELVALCKKKDEGDIDAYNRIVEGNLGLVVYFAKFYLNCGLSLTDLIQEGNIGLMKAVEKYDYTLGYKFSTFAGDWIMLSITRAIKNQSRNIRIPTDFFTTINKAKRVLISYYEENGRDLSVEELASMLNIPVEKAKLVITNLKGTTSLDAPISNSDGEEETTLSYFMADPTMGRDLNLNEICLKEFRQFFINCKTITERQKEVLMLRYGFVDGVCYSLEDIGKMFNVKRERIRQIEDEALYRLSLNPRVKSFY